MGIAKDTIKEIIATVSGFKKAINSIVGKATKLINIIQQVKSGVTQLSEYVERIKLYLEFLYLAYVEQCTIPEEIVNTEGNETEEVILSTEDILNPGISINGLSDNLSIAFKQLEDALNLTGQKRITEQLYKTQFDYVSQQVVDTHMVSYKVKLVPIENG